ncbi:PAS domain-containing protein [Thalassovita sp.]|uniref:PAS domain-containing protein n=1 Tax=Thalassovita sp. TaxID=1979401 RepID=UPI002AB036C6|nr:PAS domain-containing protein [Thalassovita sp.]
MNMQPKGNFEVDEDLELPLPVVSTDEEEAYGIEELFFSRTDERGVIQSYNDTFERIAGFTPGELMGAPHKLVRHGDVPKAVFWLLWNGLKAGVPVGAYVKNRTKSGKYYWVYAVASPITDGFLSVRMKPSSPLFAQVQKLYQAALRDEQELGLSAEDSAHRLLEQLQSLGFPTYAMFQSHAFYTEFEARRDALDLAKDPVLTSVDVITSNTAIFQRELALLARKFDHAVLLITNMEIVANKQQVGQSVLRAIAQNYSMKMRGIEGHLANVRVHEELDGIWGVSRDQNTYFLLCAAHLMEDMTAQFDDQARQVEDASMDLDTGFLHDLLNSYKDQSLTAVGQSVEAALKIKSGTEYLRELILALSNIRIACRVEMARLANAVSGLEEILTSLETFHRDVDAHLDTILTAADEIVKGVNQSMNDPAQTSQAA